MNTHSFQVAPKQSGTRLDTLLTAKYGSSRSHWQQKIKDGNVLVNNKPSKPSSLCMSGDKVTIFDNPVSSDEKVTPQLTILYEDPHVLVVEKPSGLLSHDVLGRPPEPTLADFARTRSDDSTSERPGLVHRLDRETSGLVLIAKDLSTKTFLQNQFKQRKIKKNYILLVEGHLKQPEALIDLPIGRKPNSAKRYVTPLGKPSQTSYNVLSDYENYSLIEAKPQTGRTHQLRVHFAHLGHPIVGDKLYGRGTHTIIKRLFLHATAIEFVNMEGRIVHVRSDLPEELKQFLRLLQ